jgi:predicted ATPase
LAQHRVATVVGPAGIGKTRLATELLRASVDEYSRGGGGAWRVDLGEAEDLEATCNAVARTLALHAAATGRDPVGSLGVAMSKRGKMLIVLDGADECRAALASVIMRWRDAAPNIRWIATCRTELGVPGECAQTLGPLATEAPSGGDAPDAVWLLFSRMRSSRRRLNLDVRTAQTLLPIVQRLGGSPLAIELAAGAAHSSTAERSAQGIPQGTGLRGAMDATWAALALPEKRALAGLSVFAGGFDVEAAHAVLEGLSDKDSVDALERLHSRFLIALEHGTDANDRCRYSMTRSLRDYVRERLVDLAEVDSAVLRHARYYVDQGVAYARRYDEGDRTASGVWLTRETDNLLAAHRRTLPRGLEGAELALGAALALDRVLALVGPAAMRWRLLDTAIAAADATGARTDARARAIEVRAEASQQAASDDPYALPANAPTDQPAEAPPATLMVGKGGGWFRTPAATPVDLSRWGPLQRLLERLAAERESAPGEPLSVEALVAAGWPGERVLPKAGATRVYTAIASLRRLGLRDLLVRTERGYLLQPSIGIERADAPPALVDQQKPDG